MPSYRILYLRDSEVDRYRGAPPKPKPYALNPRDYEAREQIEAASPYAAWKEMQEQEDEASRGRKFGVGDALEIDSSSLMVLNFWGFDEAEWRQHDAAIPVARPGKAAAAAAQAQADAAPPEFDRTPAGDPVSPVSASE
jgi:hypothetical protein